MTTANLAISEGWNWKMPWMPSQRVALLAVMASGLWGDNDQHQQEQRQPQQQPSRAAPALIVDLADDDMAARPSTAKRRPAA